MIEKKNVPKLRFPEFASEWEQRKLSEICSKITDGSHFSPAEVNNGYPMPSVKDMTDCGFNFTTCKRISKKDYDILVCQGCKPEIGDVLVAKDGSILKYAFEVKEDLEIVILSSIAILRPDHTFINGSFLAQYFMIEAFKKQVIGENTTGTGVPRIVLANFKNVKMNFPRVEEQQILGEFMEKMDTLISLQQRKLDQIKEYKRGMLQKMFPKDGASVPELRFPGLTGEWKRCKLGDEALEILAGGDIDKNRIVERGKYPVIANALTGEGIVGYYDDYYRVEAPAVTVTGRGDVGHAQARISNFTPVVRLLAVRSNHDSYFLENAINNHRVFVESTGVPQLTVPQLSAYIITFPESIQEEQSIGTFFHNLDSLITLHQRKLEAMKEYKKGLLQQMFV